MKNNIYQLRTIVGYLGILAGLALTGQPAYSQAAYGSYVGVGGSAGFGDGFEGGTVVAARYKLLELPISIRAQALVGSGVAVVPSVSYDLPINWQADAYIGPGIVIPSGEGPPVGDKVSFAIQPGVDYAFPNSNLVAFGNAIIAFDAFRDKEGTAFSIQGGVGLRF
ncbi:MAG: hypothetical protein WBA24_10800 [Geitlerinemataceae cyanobacterium]